MNLAKGNWRPEDVRVRGGSGLFSLHCNAADISREYARTARVRARPLRLYKYVPRVAATFLKEKVCEAQAIGPL